MRNATKPALLLAAACLTILSASIVTGPTGPAVAQDGSPRIIDSRGWRAWVDAMPGPGKRAHPLYVTGKIELTTPGYKVTLVKANPRDTRAPFLVLDLEIKRERPPDAQVITLYTPYYADPSPPRRYSGVQIRYQGKVLATIDRISTIR